MQLALVQQHQAAGDAQAQARAAELPRGGGVGLRKLLENGVELVGGDADAGVAHGQPHAPVAGRGHPGRARLGGRHPAGAGGHVHAALGGELEGVAHQIYQYLAQAHRVAEYGGGHVGADADLQAQVLAAGGKGKHAAHPP